VKDPFVLATILTQGDQGWNGDPMGVTTTTCLTCPDGGLAGVAEDRVVRDIIRRAAGLRGRGTGERESDLFDQLRPS